MYRIVICDDNAIFANEVFNKVSSYFSIREIECEYHVFTRSQELLMDSVNPSSLYLLDIMMPDFSGLELAELIRKNNPLCSIIFVSSVQDAVFESIRYAPLRFIRKEYLDQELPEALDTFLVHTDRVSSDFRLSITHLGKTYTLPASGLLYIESSGHYLILHSNSNDYQIRGKLSSYESQLASFYFARSTQSHLVNIRKVSGVSAKTVFLDNGMQLPLSRTCKSSFTSAYLKYQRELGHVLSF